MRSWTCLVIIALLAGPTPGGQVETVDGRTVTGTILDVSDVSVRVDAAEGEQTIERRDVASVIGERAAAAGAMTRAGQPVVVTAGGDVLAVRDIHLADGQFVMTHNTMGTLTVDLAAIRAVYIPERNQTPAEVRGICEQMQLADGPADRLLVVGKDGKMLSAEGVLLGIGPAADGKTGTVVTFTWADEDREIALSKVRAILVAGARREGARRGYLTLTDGSTVSVLHVSMADGRVRFGSADLGDTEVAWEAVAAIGFAHDRVIHLGDLAPAEVIEHGLMDWTFPHRVDASAGGGPLTLGGRSYERGLGVHSFCQLSYDLGGEYAFFLATVGIDDAVGDQGDATLTISADGKPLAEPMRLTGAGEAERIRLVVDGAERLTIRVDFGDDELDVADHVDLAEARLVRATD